MIKISRNIVGIAAASLALVAASAGAQGKGHDKGDKDKNHGKGKIERVGKDDRDEDRDERNDDRDEKRNRDIYVNGQRVPQGQARKNGIPPGLAKKPGGMPPGQYKKRYGTTEGASVLGDILGRRGYTVVRTTPAGDSRYVYYRGSDGLVRRAIVSQGTDRLRFSNVPSSLLSEVLARLY